MAYKTYSQSDSRWSKNNYDGSSMSNSGCGPTAVADLAFAVDGKTNPWDVAKWMKSKGYAVRGWGTAWAGIPAAMKHFGLTNVKNVAKMSDVFNYISKGYCAVFLMTKGSRGGCVWTTSGHFIAVTGYERKNGKNYVYTRDPGWRDHTGWYCYEDKMRGLIPQVWVGIAKAKTPDPVPKKPTGKYSGAIPKPVLRKGSTGTEVGNLQNFLNWYLGAKLKVDKKFGGKTFAALKKFQTAEGIKVDGIYGNGSQKSAKKYKAEDPKPPTPTPTPPKSKTNAEKLAAKAKEFAYAYGTKKSVYNYPKGKPKAAYKKGLQTAYGDRKGWGKQTKAGASCDVFAGTCIRCSGYDKKFPRGLAEQIPYIAKSSKWKSINPKKLSDLKPGDVIIWKKTSGVGHICIYIGGSKVCEAGYKTKRYGCTTKKSADYFIPSKHKKGYKTFKVYRCSK